MIRKPNYMISLQCLRPDIIPNPCVARSSRAGGASNIKGILFLECAHSVHEFHFEVPKQAD
jgi:hypothetical protein